MRVPVRLRTSGVSSSSVETWAAQLPQPGTAFRSIRGGWLEIPIYALGSKGGARLCAAWPFGDGTPPHDTAGDIFARPDAEEFERCFVDSLGLTAPSFQRLATF